MLPPVTLSTDWLTIRDGLGEDWGEAQLALVVPDTAAAARAAALLAPLMPGRRGNRLTVAVTPSGPASDGALSRAMPWPFFSAVAMVPR